METGNRLVGDEGLNRWTEKGEGKVSVACMRISRRISGGRAGRVFGGSVTWLTEPFVAICRSSFADSFLPQKIQQLTLFHVGQKSIPGYDGSIPVLRHLFPFPILDLLSAFPPFVKFRLPAEYDGYYKDRNSSSPDAFDLIMGCSPSIRNQEDRDERNGNRSQRHIPNDFASPRTLRHDFCKSGKFEFGL